ncbi:hypothetical protein AX15_006300 [Amanita polypyramis BW_CC]|nr:hypothetical protein AX15_006300 [Amanita polypyramis BW_CC]
MFNSLGQGPCEVARYMGGACNNGVFYIPPLGTDQVYIGPTPNNANECRCSSVLYSLLNACALCQHARVSQWDAYYGNCSTPYVAMFPGQIPPGTAVPHWAYMDVTQFGGFNATYAQQLSDSPESTAGSSATSTPSSSPPHKSSIAGPVAGGVVGGVIFVALVAVAVLLLLRYRRKSSAAQVHYGVEASGAGGSLPESKLSHQPYVVPVLEQEPLLYNPSDPRTFPSSIAAAATTGNTNIKPAFTGSSFSSEPSRHYTGAPEI